MMTWVKLRVSCSFTQVPVSRLRGPVCANKYAGSRRVRRSALTTPLRHCINFSARLVGNFSPVLVRGTTKVYSDVAVDVVMESNTPTIGRAKRLSRRLLRQEKFENRLLGPTNIRLLPYSP